MSLLALLFAASAALAASASAAPAAPGADVRLERVVDAEGRRVASVARLERREGAGRVVVRLVRGLGPDDLVLRERTARSPSGEPSRVREIWLADRAALRLRALPDGRLEASTGLRDVRFFEEDAGTRTVRCALLEAAEGLDARLVGAAAAYGRLPADPAEKGAEGLDQPAALLRALLPAPPAPPGAHRLQPMAADDPEREGLAAAARAAASRP